MHVGAGAGHGPGRARVLGLVSVFGVLAAAGAATGTTPRQAVSAPVRFFFPEYAQPAPVVTTTTTTVAPCVPGGSLQERAARVLIVGLPHVTVATQPLVSDILAVGVGGILITGQNVETRSQVTRLIADIKARSRHPMVVSTDEEPGRVTSLGHVIGYTSSARRLARERTTEEMRELAREQAVAMAAIGITLDLAPVADLDGGPSDGTIGDRSFSADPLVAGRYAHAYATGLGDGGVKAAAKHFPGRAQAGGDDHLGRITSGATMESLQANDLKPFSELIRQGIPVVMTSNVDYAAIDPNTPASMSPRTYQMLRAMGFEGVAVTDSIGMGAVNQRWDMAEAAVKAVHAGADGVLTTDGNMARDMVHALVVAVQQGELAEDRLNQAAGRMTALAGGDPKAFACQSPELPRLQPLQ